MELLFWASVLFVLYTYAGYPVLLGVWARLRPRPAAPLTRDTSRITTALPGVTIIIAARNEGRRLPARIANLLASDYPAERMEIIVASDGSTDDTVAALAAYRDRVTVLDLPAAGKPAALNAAVRCATQPILVFADARQRFAPDAVRRLVTHFGDPHLGAVSGELMIDPAASTIGDGVGAYWTYEKWLRRHESQIGSTLGVTGAIYAMRRCLWQPLPVDTLLDDVLGPMRVVLRGYRVGFEPAARAFDEAAADASAELRRKVRTLAGNFQLFVHEPRLALPGVNPVWLQFFSHKVGRLFVPYALLALLVSSAGLALTHWYYATAFAAQLAFYGLAAYGAVLDRRAAPVTPPATEVFREAA